MKTTLAELYNGDSPRARRFRLALIALDLGSIAFFLVASFIEPRPVIGIIELALGVVFAVDFAARLMIAPRRWRFFFDFGTQADLVVIFSLLAPLVTQNFSFLRVLRALRLVRSYHALAELRGRSGWFSRNEQVLTSVINLAVFVFVITALVYVFQVGRNPAIGNYIDALYFIVATLSTTGFGDITLVGTSGRFLAILIMIFGISLFLRLAQTIFRPGKVRYSCPQCGLSRHDSDAVHCKHCGTLIHIETEGA